MKRKIIIIGAGPAGLTAAYKLLAESADFEVIILEKANRCGGLSCTIEHHGSRMDLGGHRFFSKVPEVNALWREIMPMQGAPAWDDLQLDRCPPLTAGGPDPETDDTVMLSRRRVSRIFYRKHFLDYPIRICFRSIAGIGLADTVLGGFSYLHSVFRKLPETSLENFYINRFGKKLYSLFFEKYTEKLWGRHPRSISAEWGAQRVKGMSIAAVLKNILLRGLPFLKRSPQKEETSLIESFIYPKYGPGQLWECMAEKIRAAGGTILYEYSVEEMHRTDGRIAEVVARHHGKQETFAADLVISSMPVRDLAAGLSGIPDDVAHIAAGLPYRDFVTVGMLTDRLTLPQTGERVRLPQQVADCWIYIQSPEVRLGRVQIFNNWSPYLVSDPAKYVWIGLEYFCSEQDDCWKMSDEAWRDLGKDELIRIGMLAPDAEIRDFRVERVPKAYPAYFDTYAQMDALRQYLDGIANLYCIGRNGQHRYNNMDHSMATALAAVRHILSPQDSRKSAIWEVNTEQVYHETSVENKA